jgi:hypothetical protein
MGGRGRDVSIEDRQGQAFGIAKQPNEVRSYKVVSEKYQPLLVDSRGRPRMFETPEAAISAARKSGLALTPNAVPRPAGAVRFIDHDLGAYYRNVQQSNGSETS